MRNAGDRGVLAKRTLDLFLSLTLIVLTLPLMALIAVLVRMDSRGRAVFKQTRIGMDGRPFTMYKFRSMVQKAEELLPCLVDLGALKEPVYKLHDDPRVTRFGKILRKSSLDELPQLFNVLRGDMSLVGPRPEAENVVELYDETHRRRLQAKPGITGLQQIKCRGSRSMDERLKYDLYYIEHRSIPMDLWILFRTCFAVIRRKGIH